MNKFLYILICLVFSVKFWDLAIIMNSTSSDVILFFTWIWILSGIYFFNETNRRKSLNNFRYTQTMYFILLGVFIAMFSAYYFGGQSFMTTFISQRGIYSFIFLPAILFVQPTEKDIVKALKWISIGTVVVWILVHFKADLIKLDKEDVEKFDIKNNDLSSKLEFYVIGIYFVALYVYFKMEEYVKSFSWKAFLEVSFFIAFIILYQNRSMILGVVPIFLYTLIKFKSEYKTFIIIGLSIMLIIGIFITSDIWLSLIDHTQNDLSQPDYNRWKALNYYISNYSSNWFCYIFGNGYPSGGNSPLGNLMWANFDKGIFADDLGMLGMWVDFGIIPLIAMYSIIIRILRHKYFPLYLKFICLHIVFVPTIFHFWSNPGVSFFVIIIYLHAYYTEQYKKTIKYVRNYNSKL